MYDLLKGCFIMIVLYSIVAVSLLIIGVDVKENFEIGFFVLAALIIIGWIVLTLKEKKREKIKATAEKNENDKRQAIKNDLSIEHETKKHNIHDSLIKKTEQIASEHKDQLARERSRLIYQDAYGIEKSEKWSKEGVEYFINNVLLDELDNQESTYLSTFYGEVAEIVNRIALDTETEFNLSLTFDENMTGLEFEKYCKQLLVDDDWDVIITKSTGDQGVDLIAMQTGAIVAVQCKKSKLPIGNKAVQEIVSGARHYKAKIPVVVTNSSFTESAKNLAKTNGVFLLHFTQLRGLFQLLDDSNLVEYVYTDDEEWEKIKCEAGVADPEDLYFFGLAYFEGDGVKKDIKKGLRIILLAAEQNYVLAQSHLGLIYDLGKDVKQDYHEAHKWYQRAADLGDDESQYNLGQLYEYGRGVDADIERAYFWYLVSERGRDGLYNLSGIESEMTNEQIEKVKKQASKWLLEHSVEP